MAAHPRIGIIMGSDSDLPTMQGAITICQAFAVPYEARVVSAHRTPDVMATYAKEAADRGLQAIIAGAGGAAHLPGMVAAYTTLPVIGVPVSITDLQGMDALLSIVQMPVGIPVATVAIGNSTNAALLAMRILGATDPAIRAQLERYAQANKEMVAEKDARLQAALG